MLLGGREVTRVRTAVSHGNPKPLRASHHHVGPHGTGALQHEQRHQIGRKDGAHLALCHTFDKSGEVFHFPVGVGVLDEATEDDLLVDVDKLTELGVKNKKHMKKLAKLKKEAKKKQKKKGRAAQKDAAKDDL